MNNLGVLWGKGDQLPDRVTPLLEVLAGHGLSTPSDDLIGVIRIALMHRSFIHENKDLLPEVTSEHLEALGTFGSIFLLRTAATNAYERYGELSNGLLSREANHIGTLIPTWAGETPWLRSGALLSKSIAPSDMPK